MKWCVCVVAMTASQALAAGVGVEFVGSGGSVVQLAQTNFLNVRLAYDLALNGRFHRRAWGGLEVWARATVVPLAPRSPPSFGGSVAVAYRTPHLVTGAINWNLAAALGGTVLSFCDPGRCSLIVGPRFELTPTVELAASELLRPYLAINTSVTWVPPASALWLTVGLAVGLHFDFTPSSSASP